MNVEKAVDWAKRAREYAINDDAENMFSLLLEIWNDGRGGLLKMPRDNLIQDLKSMLQADTLSELKQCVYDLLDELEGED